MTKLISRVPSIDLEVWESLLRLCKGGDQSSIFELCNGFLATGPTRLQRILAATRTNDFFEVSKESRALKESAGNIGARRLSGLCLSLEGLANASALQVAGESICIQMQEEYRQVEASLKELMGKVINGNSSQEIASVAKVVRRDGFRVLIVDDDPFYRSILTRVVSNAVPGTTATVSEKYKKAIDELRHADSGVPGQKPFNLVIADLNLQSDASGLDLWTASKTLSTQCLFLLISGMPLDKFLARIGDQTEIPAYMPKPFMLEQCEKMIRWLVQQNRQPDHVAA
jgi:HPt (histidine-containing phosphotransfer) domain-containing protein